MGAALDSLLVNSTDRTRVLLRLDGATRNDDVAADSALLSVERAVPIRRFFARPGKRNYDPQRVVAPGPRVRGRTRSDQRRW